MYLSNFEVKTMQNTVLKLQDSHEGIPIEINKGNFSENDTGEPLNYINFMYIYENNLF
jgi:hypothetical protein